MSGERTFAMFCTITAVTLPEWSRAVYLFAEVADEVAAVTAFRSHVEQFGPDHVPYIHMEPMRAAWSVGIHLDPDEIDRAANLFRQPAEASS